MRSNTGQGFGACRRRPNYIGRASVDVETTEWYAPGVGLIKRLRKERISSPAIDPGEYQVVLRAVRRE